MNATFPKSTITMIHETFSNSSNKTDSEIEDEIKNFITFIEDISMQLTFGLTSVKRYKNIFEYTASHDVNSCCKADHKRIDNVKFERIKPILTSHEQYIRDNLTKKSEVKSNMVLLKFASFLVPALVGLKKKMKIPDLNNLLPIMTGEDIATERLLPPHMIGPDFKSKTFKSSAFDSNRATASATTSDPEYSEYSNIIANEPNKNPYFSLHGGVQFELETCQLKEVSEYDE